jgi:hypothetical protein
MAKRQLGGAGGSKLGQLAGAGIVATITKAERPAIKRETAGSRRNHTVRLSGTEETRLQRLITKVSEEAGRPISEADLMRGLLVLGDKTEAKALVSAVKDARFDAD